MKVKVYAIKDCGINLGCEVLLTVEVDPASIFVDKEKLCKDIKEKFYEKDQDDLNWGLPDLESFEWRILHQSFPED